ncbi:MAG: hypothetical protein LBH10_06390 [Burkholderiaceae bacterium]|jgi:hypothetical protein|nr:hypothetical protein [Burkholderiaceae bacterium]
MSASFTAKRIDLNITLKQGVFSDTGTSRARLSGLRVSADISKAGLVALNSSAVRVWGLRESMMNELSTMGALVGTQLNSSVDVYAGDASGTSLVYSGDVMQAQIQYQGAPDVPLMMTLQTGQLANIAPAPALSYRGAVDAATVMAQLAQNMGLHFENTGVHGVMLSNPNFPGTDRAKAAACANAARINWTIDDGTLAIWPLGGARDPNGGDIPVLSPDTGMVGYPAFDQLNMTVRCLFNPALIFGARVRVESAMQNATGLWSIISMAHALESQLPNGQWFTTLTLTRFNYV